MESIAVEATAPPSSEIIQESKRSVTPVQGMGEVGPRSCNVGEGTDRPFNRHKRYPTNRRSVQSAEILVSFVLDETGHVLSSNIVQGSGEASFDDAALAMIRRSDPVRSLLLYGAGRAELYLARHLSCKARKLAISSTTAGKDENGASVTTFCFLAGQFFRELRVFYLGGLRTAFSIVRACRD